MSYLLLVLSLFAGPVAKPKPLALPQELFPSVTTPLIAPITVPDPTPAAIKVQCGNGWGSGTVVACAGGRSLVLTAAHVAAADDCLVHLFDRRHAGRVIARDRWSDLALVVVDAKLATAVIADVEPKPGSEVVQYGYTHALQLRKSVGVVQPWDGSKVLEGTAVFGTTAMTDSGDSGCGAFVGGRLVAVVVRKEGLDPRAPGAGRCVQLADVRRFVRDEAKTLFPNLHKTLCEKDVYPPGWVGDQPMHGGPVPPVLPQAMPAAPPLEKYDPYRFKDYAALYAKISRPGGRAKLFVGVKDTAVGTYEEHLWVPSGFKGLRDGIYEGYYDQNTGVPMLRLIPAAPWCPPSR